MSAVDTKHMVGCVVAMGARTPVGLRATTSGVAIHAGVARLEEHPTMKDKAGDPFVVGMDRSIEAVERSERMHALALSALNEVLETIPTAPNAPLPIFLGLPEYGEYYDKAAAYTLGDVLTAALVKRCKPDFTLIPEGNAAAVVGMEKALAGLKSRAFDLCVVGGVDSHVFVDLLEDLDDRGRLSSATNRWGYPPGEAAGMLAVSTPLFARTNSLEVLAWVASATTSFEPANAGSDLVCTGEGLAQVMVAAAAAAGTSIDRQYCDIDGDRHREHEFSFALQRAPPATFSSALDYIAPADRWGNVGAASAPLLTMLPIVAAKRGLRPTRWPMVWCSSEGGRRGALVLHCE